MCESEDLDRFSISARCHAFLHPIALGCGASGIAPSGYIEQVAGVTMPSQ
jgi:hypothetical protein